MNHDAVTQIQKVLKAIERNLEEPLDRKTLIHMTYLSSAAFYPLFRNLIGTSVKDYIQRRRLSVSCEKLIDTNESILAIALRYQYESYESYSRAFKRLTGVSPRKYRSAGILTNPYGPVTIMESHAKGDYEMKRRMNQEQIKSALQSHSGSLLDIDIDGFDSLNQEYGRDAGDYILSEIPKRINLTLHDFSVNSESIRIHNDEFLVALPDSLENQSEITETLLSKIRSPYEYRGKIIKVTVSIGVTPYTMIQDWAESMDRAESAMNIAKKNGKNQIYKA